MFDDVPGPELRLTQVRELGRWLVGEHVGTHVQAMKPRAVCCRRTDAGFEVSVAWLSDSSVWPINPMTRGGLSFVFSSGRELRCRSVACEPSTGMGALLVEAERDVAGCGSVVDIAFRSRSPWILASQDRWVDFDPAVAVARLARRWNDMCAWTPAGPERANALCVPDAVIDALRSGVSCCAVGEVRAGRVQVAFKPRAGRSAAKPEFRPTISPSVVVRLVSGDPLVRMWFVAVVRFAAWSGIGSHTTCGMGAVDVGTPRSGG